jgi:anthraniloyl-CoA monooxygenase
VVFSDGTLGRLREADRTTYDEITERFMHWDDIETYYRGRVIRSGGHGFCGIARQDLLDILTRRAEALGVAIEFEHELSDETELAGADVIVAADGINSTVRRRYGEHFQPDIDMRACKYIWLGTHRPFDAFYVLFRGKRERLVPGALLSVRDGMEHLHRRDDGRGVARRRAGAGER